MNKKYAFEDLYSGTIPNFDQVDYLTDVSKLVYEINDAKWTAKSIVSKTKPIYTALTPDIVESFKKFKDAVHALVKLNTSPKPSTKPAPKPAMVYTPVNSSIVQVSPAFVKQDESLTKLNIFVLVILSSFFSIILYSFS